MPPPCTAGQALWHSESVVHEPQEPASLPPLLPLLLELPLSSSSPLLLPEELLVLPLLLLLPLELLLVLPLSLPGTPLSPKLNPLVASP